MIFISHPALKDQPFQVNRFKIHARTVISDIYASSGLPGSGFTSSPAGLENSSYMIQPMTAPALHTGGI